MPYATLAARVIRNSAAASLLGQGRRNVVVLERLARSAGSTNWYVIRADTQLDDLAAKVSPGSSISLYFDRRVAHHPYDEERVREILEIARRDRDAVVGRLSPDGMTLEVDFVSNREELDEFTQWLSPGEDIYFGAFPGRDDDGVNSVTIDLPDTDGVVRQHPH
jgi:hypothetical protein